MTFAQLIVIITVVKKNNINILLKNNINILLGIIAYKL